MQKKFKTTWFYSSLNKREVEKGLIFKEKNLEVSQRMIDFDEYAKLLEKAYEEFDEEGYEVINVIPISMGTSEQCIRKNNEYVGDVGFSITRGAVIVGKRK